ncbi:metal tolerance protein 9 [Quercus suber]|uniref:Metal tolerance protein 9 n=1 Tax=Quercus suber TaxID=58331 RepID=A0AAW0L5T9_QUESU
MSSESRSILEPLLPPEVEGNDMSLPPEVEVEVEGNDMSLPLPEVDVDEMKQRERMAILVTNIASIVLFALKVFVSIESKSLSIIASILDSFFDLLWGFILWLTTLDRSGDQQQNENSNPTITKFLATEWTNCLRWRTIDCQQLPLGPLYAFL